MGSFKKLAFTLAEVLIVLGIIGVVAQMTIPTLMQGVTEQSTMVSLKKAYSTFANAYTLAVQENGTPDQWGLTSDSGTSGQGALDALNILAPYLKLSERCDLNSGCFPAVNYMFLNKAAAPNFNSSAIRAKFVLADGMIGDILIRSITCSEDDGDGLLDNVCGDLDIDVNGAKGPNAFGRDYFRFWLTKNGVLPKGTQSSINYTFAVNCITNNGEACAAWVIYNGNLDYLKCPTQLSWDGQHKCN